MSLPGCSLEQKYLDLTKPPPLFSLLSEKKKLLQPASPSISFSDFLSFLSVALQILQITLQVLPLKNPLRPPLPFSKLHSLRSQEPASHTSLFFLLSLFLQPIPTFSGKPSPASLFQQSAAWLPSSTAWRLLQLVPRMERGPPHTSRVLPAPLIYIKKLNTPWLFKGGLHIAYQSTIDSLQQA